MITIELRAYIGGLNLETGEISPPHSFLMVTGPDGIERGFGFAPDPSGLVESGHVQNDTGHAWTTSSGRLEISEAQYVSLMSYIASTTAEPPVYAAFFGSQCSTWVVNALAETGIIPVAPLPGMEPENILVDFVESLIFNPWLQSIGIALNDLYLRARNFVRRDPLAIDLDGDGIETVGVDAGVLFDHDADAIKTGTGWLKGDDAFVVLDRNGNGLIDSGRELFGVDTLVGTNPYAGICRRRLRRPGQPGRQRRCAVQRQ